MELSSLICVTFCILLMVSTATPIANARGSVAPKFFNVLSYGANADGKTDNSKAFLRAWNAACHYIGLKKRILIPKGTYMVNSVTFIGECVGEMGVLIKGTLKAPTDPNIFYTNHWIGFQYVHGLVVSGGGYLDGQGASAWGYNDCFTNPNCKTLPVTMSFDFVTNARVHHLRSVNSKAAHFNLFACNKIDMSYLRLSAPETSPNTDGIRIGYSNNITISRANIGTGDDCVSILSGARDINISKVSCGLGHGISIGSLGRGPGELPVTGVTVRSCNFSKTLNGVRIKSWARPFLNWAKDFLFEDIQMNYVNNPIIIDQQYCPQGNCGSKDQSAVQIQDVTFRNIRGTSCSKDALLFKCSALLPCRNVTLMDINLSYKGPGGPATSSCVNVRGNAYGTQHPSGCL